MEYNESLLKKIYDEAKKNKLSFSELDDIKKELTLVCSIMDFDEFVLPDIIDTLKYFKKINILNKVNKETIQLLCQITFGDKKEIFEEDNTIYINQYLRNLLLPFDKNNCDKDYNIKNFLGEFDIFINLIRDNCNIEDYKVIYKYNKDLFEIAKRFYEIMQDLEKLNAFMYGTIKEKMLLNGIISHIATLLYLSLDKYEFQYDLLNEAYKEILNNMLNLLIICEDYQIFQDIIPNDEKEILREYKYASDILDNKYKDILKRRKL